MSVAAIVTAAGSGQRLGEGLPKALRLIGGEPMVVHAARAMAAGHGVALVVVVAPVDFIDTVREFLVRDADVSASGALAVVVPGGRSRQESVSLGLAAVPADYSVVLVHDAARPLVPVTVVDAVIAGVEAGADAVIPVVDVTDTIRSVDAGGLLVGMVDRSTLRSVQTPQGFAHDVLAQAHVAFAADAQREGTAATDDAALVERWGRTVITVPGSQEAFKVTRPFDLAVAEAILASRGDERFGATDD